MDDDEMRAAIVHALCTDHGHASLAEALADAGLLANGDAHGEYASGWRDAVDAAGLCGAYNEAARPDIPYRLCVKPRAHGGKHDDMWTPPWGDPHATGPANRRDAAKHYAQIRQASHDPQP